MRSCSYLSCSSLETSHVANYLRSTICDQNQNYHHRVATSLPYWISFTDAIIRKARSVQLRIIEAIAN